MNINEIITNPPRDEYLDSYLYKLNSATPQAKIKGLTLKKTHNPSEISYGLFDEKDRLVGYLGLDYRGNDMWEVNLVQLATAYKGQGLGTFLYDYAVMNDNLKVLSDATQTGGPHGSRNLWQKLRDNNRYKVVGYDTKTGKEIPEATPEQIWDNKPNTRWLALPPGETINESITRIQNLMKNRWVVWYGPGTTTEDYFNY